MVRPLLALVFCLTACSVDHTGLLDGSAACLEASDCNDLDPCTTDDCVEGQCVFSPCPLGTSCVESECMANPICDQAACAEGERDEATCSVGNCEGDLCIRSVEDACNEPDMLCCGGACIRCVVDDPCMQPACVGGVCGAEPVEAGMRCSPNNEFCRGVGQCNASGSCENVEMLCEIEGPEGCDEVNDLCVGCITPAGCPDSVVDVDCRDLLRNNLTSCLETANQEVTEFTCTDNLCVVSNVRTPEVQCPRDDGETCGDRENSLWSLCMYDGTPCDEQGDRTRTVTEYSCQAQVCVPMTRPDMEMCPPRDQTGVSCGAGVTFGDWSGCDGFSPADCGQTGMEARDIRTDSCLGGSCERTTDSGGDTRSCSRSTDGTHCQGGTTTTRWGDCEKNNPGDVCSRAGTRTRTVTTRMCGSGMCDVSPTEESEGCTMPPTDGTSCGSVPACGLIAGNTTALMNCEGTQLVPQCVSGACMDVPTTCPLPEGTMCQDPVSTTCEAAGSPICSDGTQVQTSYMCNAGGTCTPNAQTIVCNPDGQPCSDASTCVLDGTCTGGSCAAATLPCAMCEPVCTMGDSCGCDGAGLCECD